MKPGFVLFLVFLAIAIIIGTFVLYITTFSNKICGGFIGESGQNRCAFGFRCDYGPAHYPDATGKCAFDPAFTVIEWRNRSLNQ